jgi:hypothetical protein
MAARPSNDLALQSGVSALAVTTCVSLALHAQEGNLKIKITINNNTVAMGKLESSDTAQQFAALLPLSLTLEDYSKTEKIGDLPEKLTTKGALAAITPKSGEIDSNAEAFNVPGLSVTIEASK